MELTFDKESLEIVKDICEISAFVFAALFFIWKLFTGWLLINLKVSIEANRQSQVPGTDLLTFKVILEKGSIDTLQLQDVTVRISSTDNTVLWTIRFEELMKLSIQNQQIDWDKPARTLMLTMSPTESLHFGRSKPVPSDIPILVELAVLGERTFGRRFQWRSSISSAPLVNTI